MGRVVLADIMAGIDHNLGMQVVIFQQNGRRRFSLALKADTFFRVRKARRPARMRGDQRTLDNRIPRHIGMGNAVERGNFVKQGLGTADNFIAARRVIAADRGHIAVLGNNIRAVKRIIQAAPAGIGRVDCKAGIFDWHHKLRAGNLGNFRVDIGGFNLEIRPFGNQIADLFKKRAIGGPIMGLALARHMPSVNLGLQFVALGEQCLVCVAMRVNDISHRCPESLGRHIRARNGLICDKIRKLRVDLKACQCCALCHLALPVSILSPSIPKPYDV